MKFNQKLKNAMQELNIRQAQLAGMTGIGKSSISQYLSGMNVPAEEKRRHIAESLGLDPEYFSQPGGGAIIPKSAAVERLSPEDAGKIMGIDKDTVRKGLQQGCFPWGYGIQTSPRRWVYFINARRFAEMEGIRYD